MLYLPPVFPDGAALHALRKWQLDGFSLHPYGAKCHCAHNIYIIYKVCQFLKGFFIFSRLIFGSCWFLTIPFLFV